MAKDLDLITVLNQLGAHADLVAQQLDGVIVERGNVKGSGDHLTAINNQPKNMDNGIV